ncbi:MAG TPA: biotin/lipoyl-containing protein, partial [Actinomycetospora sp.]|nr:biotin/lipoyl-containing protein [Actinomycetospora sp.]
MADPVVVEVPDIGDFTDVPVIEIHVAVGSEIALDEPLLTLESDKATMDVPAETAGTVTEIRVEVGDTVSRGTPILVVTPADGGAPPATPAPGAKTGASERVPSRPQDAPAASSDGSEDRHVGLVVLGAGPGGYTAAFRAA